MDEDEKSPATDASSTNVATAVLLKDATSIPIRQSGRMIGFGISTDLRNLCQPCRRRPASIVGDPLVPEVFPMDLDLTQSSTSTFLTTAPFGIPKAETD